MLTPSEIYTIGHSNHSFERFVDLLRERGIRRLVDVRSRPYSKFSPHFRKAALSSKLIAARIGYEFLGQALGGLLDPELILDDGTPDYQRRSRSRDFQDGIEALVTIASGAPTAIMCAEEDPTSCHRRRLVTPALHQHGVRVLHIRKDGRALLDSELESEPQTQPESPQLPLL